MTKICIIAGNELEAYQFARGQNLDRSQWFFPHSTLDLMANQNFHVIVIGTAGQNSPTDVFNRLYNLAQERGKIGRNT